MADRSKLEIERWTKILEKTGDLERLRRYLGSLVLGREFGETWESYAERQGLVEFEEWANEKLGLKK